MSPQELVNAGLGLCDEVEKLLIEDDTDQALVPIADLGKLLDELAKDDPDDPKRCQQGYRKLVDILFAIVYERNVSAAMYALWIIKLLLAEDLQDDSLFQTLLKSPPQIGVA